MSLKREIVNEMAMAIAKRRGLNYAANSEQFKRDAQAALDAFLDRMKPLPIMTAFQTLMDLARAPK